MQENLLHEHTSFIPITLDNARWVGGVTKKFRKLTRLEFQEALLFFLSVKTTSVIRVIFLHSYNHHLSFSSSSLPLTFYIKISYKYLFVVNLL